MKRELLHGALAASVSVVLAACGGEDGNSTSNDTQPIARTITGKAIDDYIQGATVFLDMNGNGELDADEPSAITDENGEFQLPLTAVQETCASLSPLYAEVPEGAVDSGFGRVEDAYVMALPPSDSDDAQFNITPLTSSIWTAISSEQGQNTWSCDDLLASESKREAMFALIDSTVADMVRHYNLSADTIFSDFIQEQNEQAHALAVDIVRGLKRSLAETQALRAQHEDALWARVLYFKGTYTDNDNAYPDAWYRETYVFKDGENYGSLIKMEDDLLTEKRDIMRWMSRSGQSGEFGWSQGYVYESRGGDDSPYTCEMSEGVNFSHDGIDYEITNFLGANGKEVSSQAECEFDHVTDISGRYIFISDQGDVESAAQGLDGIQYMYFAGTEFTDLAGAMDFAYSADALDKDQLVGQLADMVWRFDETPPVRDDIWWFQHHNIMIGEDRVRYSRHYDGREEVYTEFPDGTHQRVCKAPDAVDFGACD